MQAQRSDFSEKMVVPGLAVILVTGLALRLYQLGSDSFWIDEIGLALAARAATLGEMLRIAHGHVMAMPLDYVAAWLVGRLSTSEAALRLPAALWGTLSLAAAYLLFARLSTLGTGLMAALLLALSPLHVQYSQEARFYAPLVFFHLLATWLVLRALERPTPQNWIWFAAAAIIGLYFHVYVVLVLVTGLGWLLVSFRASQVPARRIYFMASASAVLAAFVIGIILFGSFSGYEIPLLSFESSFWNLLGTGLGWIPFYPGSLSAWLFGGLCGVFALLGAGAAVRRSPMAPDTVLLYALFIQLGVVLGVDLLKNYFASPRQLLIGVPVMCFFTALGISALAERLTAGRRFPPQMVTLACGLLIVAASLPALANYYHGDKGRAREIAQYLIEDPRGDEAVFVIPDFDSVTLTYYLSEQASGDRILGAVHGTSWNALGGAAAGTQPAILITPYPLTAGQQSLLGSLGFEPALLPAVLSRYSHAVWHREGGN